MITSHNDGQQNEQSPLTMMVNNSTNIKKRAITSPNDGQQFHQYQQNEQSPLTMMVNCSTNINNTSNHLSQ
jgi:hypothetical protein